jgi:hypothetical protein
VSRVSFNTSAGMRPTDAGGLRATARFTNGSFASSFALTLTPVLADHPVLEGVTSFMAAPRVITTAILPQDAKILRPGDNGQPLVAVRLGPAAGSSGSTLSAIWDRAGELLVGRHERREAGGERARYAARSRTRRHGSAVALLLRTAPRTRRRRSASFKGPGSSRVSTRSTFSRPPPRSRPSLHTTPC